LSGLVLALWIVLPYRSVAFTRSDGVVVKLPAPDRLDHTSDTWDYLQIAREIYRSHRFESLFTYVPFLPDWEGARLNEIPVGGPVERFPVVWRQPGFPLLIAGAFALRGAPDPSVLLWIQGLAIVLLPLATYFLARALVSPGWAFMAGMLTLLSPLALSPASPFVATTWFVVIMTLLAGCLLRAGRVLTLGVAGVLLGVAIGFRLDTWMLIPGFLLMLWLARWAHPIRATVVFLAVAALVLVPWTRCRAQCANETFTLTSLLYHATDSFPGWTSSRTLAVRELSPITFVSHHFGEVAKKTGLDILRYGRDLVLLPSPFLAPFVWLALVRPGNESRVRAFILGTLLAAVMLVLALSPLEYSPRFLAVLVPLFTVTAVVTISRFVRYRRELVIAALAVGALLIGSSVLQRSANGTSRLALEDIDHLVSQSKWTIPAGYQEYPWIVLCDAPTLYAWVWNARAVWTPLPEDVPEVRKFLGSLSYAAIFTRAAGHGDGIAPDTIEKYSRRGLMAGTTEPPVIMYWPSPTRDGPITPQGTPP
jgi:hypothetical protein